MAIRSVVDECGLSYAVLAADSGLSYASIRAWLKGERTPEPESIAKLTRGLRARGDALHELAKKLEEETRG